MTIEKFNVNLKKKTMNNVEWNNDKPMKAK